MSPTTEKYVTTTKITVLKHLANGRDKAFTAAATGLTEDQVLDIASKHGWPDVDKIAWALDHLTEQLQAEKTAALPPAAPRGLPSVVTSVPPVRPAPTMSLAAPVDRLGQAIATARASKNTRLNRLADRYQTARDNLLGAVTEWKAQADERDAAARVRAADQARIAELKAELAKLQTKAGTNSAGRTPKNDDNKSIRAWALEQGLDVGKVGVISADVRQAYADAHKAGAA